MELRSLVTQTGQAASEALKGPVSYSDPAVIFIDAIKELIEKLNQKDNQSCP